MTQIIFLELIQVALGVRDDLSRVPNAVEWEAIKDLADRQGLSALVLDGIEKLRTNDNHNDNLNLLDKVLMLEWIGETLQGFDYRYEQYRKAIGEMAAFYNSHGFKMMVLKGYACSLDWPRPERRPCGDIDIWLFGRQKEADELLESLEFSVESFESVEKVESVKKIVVDKSHHHHTVFYWGEFMVENHYDLINVHHHKSNVELEKEFKRLAADDKYFAEVNGEKVYLPSPNLHALFLLKHTMNDFTSFSMTLRQVLDWAFHVEKHEKEIDWEWLLDILEKYHMTDFFNCLNAICVEDLGFEFNLKHKENSNLKPLKEKVLNDIFNPEFSRSSPSGLLPRLAYKYKRWRGNEWKHKLCYSESMWSAFWSGVWNHLLKPSSF